jgi:hypothetical protein
MLGYNWSEAGLAAAFLALALLLVLELRSTQRLRQVMGRDLARIFEQLDLVRFENQQLLEQRPAPPAIVPVLAPAPRRDRTDPGAATRLPAGEARLLAVLQSARARRARQA